MDIKRGYNKAGLNCLSLIWLILINALSQVFSLKVFEVYSILLLDIKLFWNRMELYALDIYGRKWLSYDDTYV